VNEFKGLTSSAARITLLVPGVDGNGKFAGAERKGKIVKKFLWLIIIVVVGFIAYTKFMRPVSDEERNVMAMEDRYETARNRYLSVSRQLAMPGEVAIADPEAAVQRLKDVKAAFDSLYESLTEKAAIARADKLQAKIEEFFEKNEIK
jgi:hypothetical protein